MSKISKKLSYRIIIDELCYNKRLDIVVAKLFLGVTRAHAKKLIELGQVSVDDKIINSPHYKVPISAVSIKLEEDATPSKSIGDHSMIDFKVVYEDEDLIAINKPTGLVVHPGHGNWSQTLIDEIVKRYPAQREIVSETGRFGLIHRLDKDTSGLILISKTQKSLWWYSKQFAERRVEKFYIEVGFGRTDKFAKGKIVFIDNYVGRNPIERKKMSVFNDIEDDTRFNNRLLRKASTQIELLQIRGNYHLCVARPLTGRTHQIRLHMAYIGLPIVGDRLYGGKQYKRLMLHAWRLNIASPKGKIITLSAEVDDEFLSGLVEMGFDRKIVNTIRK